MARRGRLHFRSQNRYKKAKKAAVYLSSALACLVLGFFSAMLILPFFSNEIPDNSSLPDGSQDESFVSSETQSSSPEVSIIENSGMRAVYIPPSVLDSVEEVNGIIASLKNTDINTVIIDIKDESGMLYYPSSSIEIVTKVENVSQNAELLRQNIKKFKDAGFLVSGRVVCFKDNTMPKNRINYRPYSVLTSSNVNWYFNNIFWMDPYKSTARDYLYSVISEALPFGFDEIILDEVKFPDIGPIDMLDYGEQTLSRAEILSEFINTCADIVHQAGAEISLKTSWKYVVSALSEESGQTFDISKLNIDYYSPDFLISSVVSSNRDVVIGGISVSSPLKNPIGLIDALKTNANFKLGENTVLKPFILSSAPFDQLYSNEQIIGQAKLFGDDGYYNFCYYNQSGIYSENLLKIE